MHPYDHALSSARQQGGVPEAYLALHGWFDATKAAYCDFRHRALRHHREGIAEAEAVFGAAVDDGQGGLVPVERLGLQHLAEDGSIVPNAADWLGEIDPDALQLPGDVPAADQMAADSARRLGGEADDYLPLHRWFLTTRDWMPDRRHLVMRHHAFGVFEAEARFGVVLRRRDGGVTPTRIVAERHVRTVLGRVPPAHALLRHIRGQPWMVAAQHPVRLGLR